MNDLNDIVKMIKSHRSICWYPSAGGDFRALLYLSNAFYNDYSDKIGDPYPKNDRIVPDLFIYSDVKPAFFNQKYDFYNPSEIERLNEPDGWKTIKTLFHDLSRTDIKVNSISRYDGVVNGLNTDSARDDFCDSKNYGSAFLMNVSIQTDYFGIKNSWKTDLLYVIGENASFAKEVLLAKHIKVDTVVQIRYGGAFGGSVLMGLWVKSLFEYLGTCHFIANGEYTDGREQEFRWDVSALESYFAPFDITKCPRLEEIYRSDGLKWSEYGDVKWCRVIRNT